MLKYFAKIWDKFTEGVLLGSGAVLAYKVALELGIL